MDPLRFAFVAVCAVIAFVLRGDKYLLLAFLFTVAADACLLLLYQNTAGVGVFVFAQLCYVRRACSGWRRLWYLPALLIAPLVLFVWRQPLLLCLSALYAQMLLCAVGSTIWAWQRGRFSTWRGQLAALGMILFLGCDICVALYNLSEASVHMPTVSQTAGSLIWFFYAPSQILLAMSARKA